MSVYRRQRSWATRWMIDQIHASGSGSERFAERVAGELATRIASRPQR